MLSTPDNSPLQANKPKVVYTPTKEENNISYILNKKVKYHDDMIQSMREMWAEQAAERASMRILLPEESNEVNWLLNVFDPSITDMSRGGK